jgi:acyl carrier protein
MTPQEVRHIIVEALKGTIPASNRSSLAARLADPAGEVSFDELGVDSLGTIEVSLRIEYDTGYPVDPGDLVLNRTINSLASFTSRKLAEGRA